LNHKAQADSQKSFAVIIPERAADPSLTPHKDYQTITGRVLSRKLEHWHLPEIPSLRKIPISRCGGIVANSVAQKWVTAASVRTVSGQ
jgi:hypothetical protein